MFSNGYNVHYRKAIKITKKFNELYKNYKSMFNITMCGTYDI